VPAASPTVTLDAVGSMLMTGAEGVTWKLLAPVSAIAVVAGEGGAGAGLVHRPLTTRDQTSVWEVSSVGGAAGVVVGLKLGKVVGEVLKSLCKSMEGLILSSAVQAVPPRHLLVDTGEIMGVES
jgi:hypothetical protein